MAHARLKPRYIGLAAPLLALLLVQSAFGFPIPPARQSESAHALPQPWFIRQCGSDWEPPYSGRFGIAI